MCYMLHKDGIFFALLLTFASTGQFVSIIHYNEVNTFSLYKELNIYKYAQPSPPSYIGRVQNLKTGCRSDSRIGQFLSGVAGSIPGTANLSPWIDHGFYDRIQLSLTILFDDGKLGKQPVTWKKYCAEYMLKKIRDSMERNTGRCDITEEILETALNTIQSIN